MMHGPINIIFGLLFKEKNIVGIWYQCIGVFFSGM